MENLVTETDHGAQNARKKSCRVFRRKKITNKRIKIMMNVKETIIEEVKQK